jgi:hypothetical protein
MYTINSNFTSILNVSIDKNITMGDILYLNLSSIFAPPSLGISPLFTIGIYQNGYIKALGSMTVTVSPNILTRMSTSITNSTISSASAYQIVFFTSDSIPSTGMI